MDDTQSLNDQRFGTSVELSGCRRCGAEVSADATACGRCVVPYAQLAKIELPADGFGEAPLSRSRRLLMALSRIY